MVDTFITIVMRNEEIIESKYERESISIKYALLDAINKIPDRDIRSIAITYSGTDK